MFARNSSVTEKSVKTAAKADFRVALAGNPNVGKSTIFNALTGLNQHTGNWTGKTVECSSGTAKIKDKTFLFTDLPGTYSMIDFSEEETVTREFLANENSDCVVIVTDATVIERNLSFALQVLSLQKNAVLCLNLCDEAEKNGIIIDIDELSLNLGIPVICTCATRKGGINELKDTIFDICTGKKKCFRVERNFKDIDVLNTENHKQNTEVLAENSKEICKQTVFYSNKTMNEKSRKADKILTSKAVGIPLMLLLFGLLFWITAVGANYPSEWLSVFFDFLKGELYDLFELLSISEFFTGILIDGVYTTLTWVVSVMLPPMAIFFPLFSIIEDSGYLPRIAFNLDKFFAKCGAHGKQSLTMAMGIGCNACGVTGCRIIESPQERLIAILTNNFMPCNGRFPTLIAIIMMFFAGSAFGILSSIEVAAILLGIIVICVLFTLLVSKLLSLTIAKGEPSGFALELPPYRKPQIIKTIVRSMLDRTLFVLGRAVIVAAPAGAVIWLTANIYIGNASVLSYCTDFLDPFGQLIGLDGVIVMAFILGFPANETVIPIIIMSYMASGTLVDYTSYEQLLELFSANGWTVITAVCTMIMCVMHFPCSTTCLTIKKETGSMKWTLVSALLPTAIGIILCLFTANLMRIFI
ncbi:ferrous iron transport protein B [uncultured Ruminococcus sp.]|uniref:ferrous iron transport protein B n=1 Tax=uncultured Ruminococcus sp. TaxID=165186 RepID=UPI0025DE00C6|nr:ferrous iron transport protein B [uncultured Ruminococcus sp.]